MKERSSKANKVHMSRWTVHKETRETVRSAMCGCDRGQRASNKVPISKELRDVTCKTCLRIATKHGKVKFVRARLTSEVDKRDQGQD